MLWPLTIHKTISGKSQPYHNLYDGILKSLLDSIFSWELSHCSVIVSVPLLWLNCALPGFQFSGLQWSWPAPPGFSSWLSWSWPGCGRISSSGWPRWGWSWASPTCCSPPWRSCSLPSFLWSSHGWSSRDFSDWEYFTDQIYWEYFEMDYLMRRGSILGLPANCGDDERISWCEVLLPFLCWEGLLDLLEIFFMLSGTGDLSAQSRSLWTKILIIPVSPHN